MSAKHTPGPSERGEFVGDIYFGDLDNSTRGTHRWDGSAWVELQDERVTMLGMLVEVREQRDVLLDALLDTLDFLERHSNRWDGVNGKHPQTVVTAARAAIAKATGAPQ